MLENNDNIQQSSPGNKMLPKAFTAYTKVLRKHMSAFKDFVSVLDA